MGQESRKELRRNILGTSLKFLGKLTALFATDGKRQLIDDPFLSESVVCGSSWDRPGTNERGVYYLLFKLADPGIDCIEYSILLCITNQLWSHPKQSVLSGQITQSSKCVLFHERKKSRD